jgi:hypothetical protein
MRRRGFKDIEQTRRREQNQRDLPTQKSMATALRFASRKICGRAFQRPPQPYFTVAAEAAVKALFPSISHGGSAVRRFSSSNSPNLVNNNKVYPPPALVYNFRKQV